LDTNALIWLEQGHPRSKPLAARRGRLFISPASILELQFLVEAGRIPLKRSTVSDVARRAGLWLLGDPPAAAAVYGTVGLSWTRDPFDRLILAHARFRGWRLATGDLALNSKLGPENCIRL